MFHCNIPRVCPVSLFYYITDEDKRLHLCSFSAVLDSCSAKCFSGILFERIKPFLFAWNFLNIVDKLSLAYKQQKADKLFNKVWSFKPLSCCISKPHLIKHLVSFGRMSSKTLSSSGCFFFFSVPLYRARCVLYSAYPSSRFNSFGFGFTFTFTNTLTSSGRKQLSCVENFPCVHAVSFVEIKWLYKSLKANGANLTVIIENHFMRRLSVLWKSGVKLRYFSLNKLSW